MVVTSAIALGNTVLSALTISTSSLAVMAGVGFLTQAAVGLALNALAPEPLVVSAAIGSTAGSPT